jgi:hypothetical protein
MVGPWVSGGLDRLDNPTVRSFPLDYQPPRRMKKWYRYRVIIIVESFRVWLYAFALFRKTAVSNPD